MDGRRLEGRRVQLGFRACHLWPRGSAQGVDSLDSRGAWPVVFFDVEAFALLFIARAADEQNRAAHARAVVAELELDARLEPLVPMRPKRGEPLRAYERVIVALRELSNRPEPERSHEIKQLFQLLESKRE